MKELGNKLEKSKLLPSLDLNFCLFKLIQIKFFSPTNENTTILSQRPYSPCYQIIQGKVEMIYQKAYQKHPIQGKVTYLQLAQSTSNLSIKLRALFGFRAHATELSIGVLVIQKIIQFFFNFQSRVSWTSVTCTWELRTGLGLSTRL